MILPDEGADAYTRRDEATVRASIQFYGNGWRCSCGGEHPREFSTCDRCGLSLTLVTLNDYRALPDVVGVEGHPGHGAVTIYLPRDLRLSAREWLQAYVREHKTMNLLVAWKTCRRQAERRRRS